jgi:hypothetical protein
MPCLRHVPPTLPPSSTSLRIATLHVEAQWGWILYFRLDQDFEEASQAVHAGVACPDESSVGGGENQAVDPKVEPEANTRDCLLQSRRRTPRYPAELGQWPRSRWIRYNATQSATAPNREKPCHTKLPSSAQTRQPSSSSSTNLARWATRWRRARRPRPNSSLTS